VLGAWVIGNALAPRLPATLRALDGNPGTFAFDPEPLRLPPRTDVSLTFENASDAPHTLIMLAPITVQTTAAVEARASARLDFTTPAPGTYRFVCNVHEGMAGTLIVE
jgi:plastocyanin